MNANKALIIFAKNPELGKVKTRLAKDVGKKEALAIYYKLLNWTKSQTSMTKAKCIVYYTSAMLHDDDWNAEKRLQANGDLGQRMSIAFQEQFKKSDKVCIIGTDCAGLTSEIIENAFELLEKSDFVIGPANDGGYYLLGMNRFCLQLFEDISWSTERVLAQSIERIIRLGKSYSLLPELIDVDTVDDWELVKGNFS